jgi:hypothetical protein
MTIELKFKEGDTIWFILNSKALENIVRGIKIERKQMPISAVIEQEIIYLCAKEDAGRTVYVKVNEKEAFPTKEALLQSL